MTYPLCLNNLSPITELKPCLRNRVLFETDGPAKIFYILFICYNNSNNIRCNTNSYDIDHQHQQHIMIMKNIFLDKVNCPDSKQALAARVSCMSVSQCVCQVFSFVCLCTQYQLRQFPCQIELEAGVTVPKNVLLLRGFFHFYFQAEP